MPTEQQIKNRREWMEAVASEHYQQGKRVLHDAETNAFCCLGVACKIADVPSAITMLPTGRSVYAYKTNGTAFFASQEYIPHNKWFADRFGVTEDQASQIMSVLAVANDQGVKFASMPDIIRPLFQLADERNKDE